MQKKRAPSGLKKRRVHCMLQTTVYTSCHCEQGHQGSSVDAYNTR